MFELIIELHIALATCDRYRIIYVMEHNLKYICYNEKTQRFSQWVEILVILASRNSGKKV